MQYAIESQPNSEIVRYYDAQGNLRSTTAVRGMSGTDPIGAFVIEGVVTGPIGKVLGKGLKALRMSKGYTGVPHVKIKGSDKYMDEAFPDYNGTIWSTNNRDYAHSFAQGNGSHSVGELGQVYRVWGTSKKPLKIPQPIEGAHYHWKSIPVKPKNKTLIKRGDSQVAHPEIQGPQLTESGVYEFKPSIDKSIKIDNGGPNLNSPKGMSTDDIVSFAEKNGKDYVYIPKVDDGFVSPYYDQITKTFRGNYTPIIDEHIYINNPSVIKAPLGTSDWKMFQQIKTNPISDYGISFGLTGSHQILTE